MPSLVRASALVTDLRIQEFVEIELKIPFVKGTKKMKSTLFAAVFAMGLLSYAAIAQVQDAKHPADHGKDQTIMSGDMAKDMQMMNEMMVKHLGKSDENYDKRFIDMMIPHHEGAVMMFKDALKNSTHAEIKEMAKKGMEEQQKEIAQLKTLRQEWYGSSSRTSSSKE